ncbi:MAG: hypothetical protein EXS01_03475 [Phycisphaerales bacterium]|nr:hypothetical protein [Phycisphaerales bacterium]
MLKFFRKNEKASRWILIVGMTLLMVSWLVFDQSSTFLTEMLTGRATWATTVDGVAITEGDRTRMQQELRAIALMGDPTVRGLGLDKDPVKWFLITREASLAGLVGGAADGQARLAEIAETNKVLEGNLLGALCRESGQSPTEVFETLAKLNGVQRYVDLIMSGPSRLSSTRLEQSAATLLAAVSGEIVVLDGSKSKVEVPAPSEAALAAQLESFGAIELGQGVHGFGYRIADRAKMEWMTVPSASITTLVEQSPALSNIELRKYWMDHQSEFAAASLATSSSASTFEGSRDAVKAKVLAATVQAKRVEFTKFISDRMQLSMRGVPQVNGYYTLPPDWLSQELSLAALSAEIAEKYGIAAPAIATTGEGWVARTEVAAIPGIGSATTNRFGSQPVNTAQLVEALREFGGKSTLITQVGVASPVLQGATGDLFVLRVTAIEASRAPGTVEAVREALIADVNRAARYEKLVGLTSEIQREAVDQGLAAVALTYGVPVEAFKDIRQGDRQFLQYGLKLPGQLPGLGADAGAVKAIVERAMGLPEGKPISELPVGERTLVIPAADKLSLVVVRIDSLTPMTQADIPALVSNQRFRSVVASDQGSANPDGSNPLDLFSFDALVARSGFKLANPGANRAEEGGDPDAESAPTPAEAGQ